MLFQLGQIVATPAALDTLEQAGTTASRLIRRHQKGDWGDICEEDKRFNDEDLKQGNRLLSAYHTSKGKVWVITEANRSVTTVLLPSDY